MIPVLLSDIHNALAWLEIGEVWVVLEGSDRIFTLEERLCKTGIIEAADPAISCGSAPYHSDVRSRYRKIPSNVAAPSSCPWSQLVNNAELSYIIAGCGSRGGKLSLLLKFSFGTTFLHVGKRAVGERSPYSASLPFLAVKIIV